MTPTVHTIRLHGPWKATVLRFDGQSDIAPKSNSRSDAQVPSESIVRVRVPGSWSDWVGSCFAGVVRCERSFGLPTNLSSDQTVWLVIESESLTGSVWLNDTPLGEIQSGREPFRQPVRELLNERNCLEVEVESANSSEEAKLSEVRLEIVEYR